ncbi:WbqC family protein [Nordella sp. HKS 07]|uniref:WbqC family protein n=1 Tax=Nordella sp. HKS 07 TaxID=2712222 RepID=UPI001FEDC8FF|nr:WbqC family protein [Nordella sp. HKS 07]
MRVVISQPMYFPWVGLLEQIRLADVFVFYDDVQLSTGAFHNRVQVKTRNGTQWLTLPMSKGRLKETLINNAVVDCRVDWRTRQRNILTDAYNKAPFFDDMISVFEAVASMQTETLSDITIRSIDVLLEYFNISEHKRIIRSSSLGISGRSTQRVLDIVLSLGGDEYITGHGAKDYLDHPLFERHGVSVGYMDYRKEIYPQLHGEFTPFVSGLDLVANCGASGERYICSNTVPWRDFVDSRA